MDQKVMKLDDLNPDGLRITINWDAMIWIIYICTLHQYRKGKKQLKSAAKMKAWEFIQICVENKKLGLRAWRTM